MAKNAKLAKDEAYEVIVKSLGRAICKTRLSTQERFLLLVLVHSAKFLDLTNRSDVDEVSTMMGLTPRTIRRLVPRLKFFVQQELEGQ